MNQYIEFDRHFYDGNDRGPEDRFEYLDPYRNDEHWSLITMEDTYKVARQIAEEGKLFDWDISYRLSNHILDYQLLEVAIEHCAYVFHDNGEFDAFCYGLWLQKYDYRHDRIAAGLLKLAFSSGAKSSHIRAAWDARGLYPEKHDLEEDDSKKWNDWLRREYRKFTTNEQAVKYKWVWSGENSNSGEAYGIGQLIRQVVSLVIWHDQLTVSRTQSGFNVQYNEQEQVTNVNHSEYEREKWDRWDSHVYIDAADINSVAASLEEFIDWAYGTGDQFRIEVIGAGTTDFLTAANFLLT